MTFGTPQALWLFLILPFFVLLHYRSFSDMGRFQRQLSIALRILLISALILAIADARLIKRSDHLSVFFLIDTSRSVGEGTIADMLEFVRQSTENMEKEKNSAGIIAFGRDALVEAALGKDPDEINAIHSDTRPDFTDIAGAIDLALAGFPGDSGARIVLLSDGNENIGDSITSARIAANRGVEISVVPFGEPAVGEVAAGRVILPRRVKEGEVFDVRAIVESQSETDAVIEVYENDKLIGSRSVQLAEGKNVFTFPRRQDVGGFYSYRINVIAEGDTEAENNLSTDYTIVEGKPRVCYVTGDPLERPYVVNALSDEGIVLDFRDFSGMPTNMIAMAPYDVIYFSDLSADRLVPDTMKAYQSFVRDLGGGFGMIGGVNSFGPGGYYRTPIEELLPVSLDLTKKGYMPSIAICLVIDRSGSMGAGMGPGNVKMEIAKYACTLVVDLLDESDMVGVVSFDSVGAWVVPMQNVRNKKAINEIIGTIRAGGGTDVYAGMYQGFQALSGANVQIRHMIVLTDGITPPADFDSLLKQMNSKDITCTAIAVGSDANTPLLQYIAEQGGGNYYYVDDIRKVPQIFTRETFLSSNRAVVEEPFYPLKNQLSPITDNINWASSPALLGYVATTIKPLAVEALTTQRNDPLLAHWQYGLGRSLAFTSDAKAKWAAAWLPWDGYDKFWTQSTRWLIGGTMQGNLIPNIYVSAGKAHISVDAIDSSGEMITDATIRARVIHSDVDTRELDLFQVAPGRYEATLDTTEIGSYLVNIYREGEEGEMTDQVSTGFSVSYPPEYEKSGPNLFLLSQLTDITGGVLGIQSNKVFAHDNQPVSRFMDLWYWLLILAVCLLPFDIAVRRLSFTGESLQYVRERVKESVINAFTARSRARTQPTHIDSLKKIKEKYRLDREREETSIGTADVSARVDEILSQKKSEISADKAAGAVRASKRRAVSTPKTQIPSEETSLSRLKKAKKRAWEEERDKK